MSVGIEDISDIVADFSHAFALANILIWDGQTGQSGHKEKVTERMEG